MSKCDLFIEVDRKQKIYQPQESIQGSISVEVNKEVNCTQLVIELCWRTHGKGNCDEQVIESMEVPNLQQWVAGSSYTYQFQFTAPKRPLTYHGHFLNIDYYIRARADIPWAIDPRAEEEVIIVAGPTSKDDYIELITKEADAEEQPKKKSSFFTTVLGWILLPVVIGLLIFAFVALWWVFTIILLVVLVRKGMQYLANKRLGNVDAQLDITTLVPGQTTRLKLNFSPPKNVVLNGATASLTGQEICVAGSGTDRRTHKYSLCDETFTIAQTTEIYGGQYTELGYDISIPPLEAYSFKANDNRVEWELAVHIDIPRYPDWKKKIKVQLIPENKPLLGE